MNTSESYRALPDETSADEDPQPYSSEARKAHAMRVRRPGRGWGLLAGLVVLAIVGVLAYNFATNYFALNGAWYGSMRMQVGPSHVSLEAYMDISTYLNGSLSGSGTFCYKNPLGGGTSSVDLKVSGNRHSDKVTISFAASSPTIGIPLLSIAIGPGLDLHGGYTTSPSNMHAANILVDGAATAVTLSGGDGAFPVTLDMKRGVVAQFASACTSLAPLGDVSGTSD